MTRFGDMIRAALAEGQPFALGVISGAKGSSPQKQGAKAIFFNDGRILGTLGGGCLEAEVRDRARRALLTGCPASFDLTLDHIFGWDDGLICGGRVEGLILPKAAEAPEVWRALESTREAVHWGVRPDYSIGLVEAESEPEDWLYTETVLPRCALWIAGSGHVAQAVARWARELDFAVTVFDDRPELANSHFFPGNLTLRVGYWSELVQEQLPSVPSFGLIVTRGHQHDALVLRSWIKKPFTFLGMIGSRRKARVIFDEFLDHGLALREELERVVCPVGLDIQSHSVPEIALSIVAQITQVRARVVFGRSPRRAQNTRELSESRNE